MQNAQGTIVRIQHVANKVRLPIGLVLFIIITTLISIPVIAMTIMAVTVSRNTVIKNSHTEAMANMLLIEDAIERRFSEAHGVIDDLRADYLFFGSEIQLDNYKTTLVEDFIIYDPETLNTMYSNSYYYRGSLYYNYDFFNDVISLYDNYTRSGAYIGQNIEYYDYENQMMLSSMHFINTVDEQRYGFSLISELHGGKLLISIINPDAIIEGFDEFFDAKNNYFMLISGTETVYTSNIYDRVSNTLHGLSGYSGTYIDNNSSEIYELGNESVIITSHDTSLYGFTLMMATPYEYIETFLQDTNRTIYTIFIITIVAAFFVSIIIANQISAPIVRLKKSMEQFAKGSIMIKSESFGNNELSDLNSSFNKMTEDISSLILNLDTQKALVENYRLRLTNEQVNPHFLYNVLEMINSLINIGMYERASEATYRLANFYRGSLSDGADIITLEREQSFLADYIVLQKMRYVEKLTAEIEISPELNEYAIPKLTLQPLAENSIYHGIRKKKGKGNLKMCVTKKGDRMVITVEDNGIGMGAERKKELLSLNRLAPITEHFGLSSILHRLNYHFNGDVKFDLDSEEGEYTIIKIDIPAVRPEQFKEGRFWNS